MSLSQQLAEYISACFTGLWLQSHEHEDALAEIAQICRDENWQLADTANKRQIIGGLTAEVMDRLKKRDAVIVSRPQGFSRS